MTKTKKLGEVFDIRKGKKAAATSDTFVPGSHPYIQIDEVRGVTPTKFAIDPKPVVVTGDDLCIVWDGANAGTVGYGVAGAIGSTVSRLRLKEPDRWDPRFLGRLLDGLFPKLNQEAQSRGATIPHVDKAKLEEIDFPLIDPTEQRRIAVILDKADAIRSKHERALNLADDFLRSVYVHTVGKDHPDFQQWEPTTIESLAADHRGSIRSGPFGSALLHSEFVDEGIAVLGIDNAVKNKFMWAQRRFVSPEKYEELRRYRVFPKDVIITIMGTTGRSAVVPDDIPEAITTKHLASVTCNLTKVVPEFLSFAIHSDPVVIEQIRSANKGAIMDGLNLGIIRKLQIKLPPMHQQLLFAKAMTKTHEFVQKLTTPLGSGTDLFASLSQRAFAGDL
jgi:type I restriction enzyme, S subunit